MNKARKRLAGILSLSVFVAVVASLIIRSGSDWFVEYPLPMSETYRLFDAGVVDANGDNLLDIYTTNHHFRQALLLADGQGGYRDVLSAWGLDQSIDFPLAELSFIKPVIDRPGLYIYWLGTQLVIRAHKTGKDTHWQGSVRFYDPVEVVGNNDFVVNKETKKQTIRNVTVHETVIEFSTDMDARLALRPGGQGLPVTFQLAAGNQITRVYVGRGKISPRTSTFSLTMQDRHAMAWADYNSDGRLDIFIPRGALAGTLRAQPDHVADSIRDELLVSQPDGKYIDIGYEAGIRKRDCSGRHARWLDFNRDGRLDLYVNCYDRGNVRGDFPKQLYLQDSNGHFRDAAEEAGIGMPDQQIGSFAWIDIDNDGDSDLVTFQDDGFFLYRNHASRFTMETILLRPLSGAQRIGHTKGDHWNFDGKLSVSDYDRDGDLDIFSASQRGNALLKNESGSYVFVDPVRVGLPQKSITANWVDFDNDGRQDLHAVPQGLYSQGKDQAFHPTGLLSFPDEQYIAAICNWADLDNDGRQDVLMMLSENHSFKRWWEFAKPRRHSSTWLVKGYRNIGAQDHWLQIKLAGGEGNRQAIGARVTVTTADGQQTQEVGSTDGAFYSQGHYRLYFGLGKHGKADTVKIRWPDGYSQELTDLPGDRLHVIKRS